MANSKKAKKYDFAELLENFQQHQNIMIVGHISPDGDTIGSALALFGLIKAYKQNQGLVQVVFADDIAANLQFLPVCAEIIKPDQIKGKPDLVVLADCATLDRTGDGWLNGYLYDAQLAIIDHHALRDEIESISIIDSAAAATGELVYYLAIAMGVEISQEVASCLYMAIASDTGGFRFANTTYDSFRIGAELMSIGVDMEQMRIQLFESRPFSSMVMMGVAMNHLQQSPDQKLVWTYISQQDKIANNAASSNCSHLSAYTMYPIGVKVGISFEEIAEANLVKLSMRCRKGYNVGELAKMFGGGGHVLAAGCKVQGSLQEVIAKVLAKAQVMIVESEKNMKHQVLN